jgi:adenine-specific DNA-methyltransferase
MIEFTWTGKESAIVEDSIVTTKELVPDREGSVNFDNTQNIVIEGDNLDALKLLQQEYRGKIKMIYIDPPYNTGKKTFQYNDHFTVGRGKTKDKHSNWLSMMYPRLKLAKELLSDDGVILVSIDDHEVHHLRLIMRLFGKEHMPQSI